MGSEEASVTSNRIRKLLVKGEAPIDKDGNISINFYVNSDQRGDTHLGEDQGDHSVSYTTIIQAILSSTNTQNIISAIDLIRSFGKAVLEGKNAKQFNNIKDPEVHTTEEREQVREILTEKLGEDNPLVKKMNTEIKHYKVMCLVECLEKLSNEILTDIQQQELTTFYSRGRIKPPAGGEKHAARALVMLDRLCALCEMEGEDFKTNLESFKFSLSSKSESETEEDHIMRYGLSSWYRVMGMDSDAARDKVDEKLKELDKAKNITKSKEILMKLRDNILTNKDAIATNMGGVIDYQRELKFNLKEAFLLTKGQLKKTKGTIDKKEKAIKNKIYEKFVKADHGVDFAEKTIKKEEGEEEKSAAKEMNVVIVRKSLKDLVSVLHKFHNVMSAAFPNLKKNLQDSGKFEECYNNFLQKEILDKGWNKLMIKDEKTSKEKPLDLETLKSLINPSKLKSKGKFEEKKGECVLF